MLDRQTRAFSGTAFVQFVSKESADVLLLEATPLSSQQQQQQQNKKKDKDGQNQVRLRRGRGCLHSHRAIANQSLSPQPQKQGKYVVRVSEICVHCVIYTNPRSITNLPPCSHFDDRSPPQSLTAQLSSITFDGRPLIVSLAVSRGEVASLHSERNAKEDRCVCAMCDV